MKNINIKKLDFEKMNGLIPAIVQDNKTYTVLMLGFMDKEALKKTLKDKKVTFYSRTRKRIWQKGETSGNYLKIVSINTDCDNDTLLIRVNPAGPVCHSGKNSCFVTIGFSIYDLFKLIKKRKLHMPKKSYTAELFKKGAVKILEKISEESKEVVTACKKEGKQRLIEESCDLLYHLFVLLVNEKIDLIDLEDEFLQRRK